ncbi:MAG TPA: hypothetical protein VN554_00550, partial [Verrucomicrobiae bacterium]|nr:hypothetical protein [Verrucomicrobiae bacterium]
DEAAVLLTERRGKQRTISLEEALIMQAASHVLAERGSFHGAEIAGATGMEEGAVWPRLVRFERRYGLTTSTYEDVHEAAQHRRLPRHLYVPTDFGNEVFGLFVAETSGTLE